MWIADKWKDYEVIDCSKGEKLERWGEYILVRPDPQVIWDTPKDDRGWRHMNGHYHRSKKGGGEWEFFSLPKQWQIRYGSLTFNLKPFSFKHTGLFPEQATNWDWFSEKIRNAGRPVKVLNLFAYTGGATLAAAAAGAQVTHVDASKGMVTWAKENAVSSGLKDAPIRWLVDDCVKFVEREIRRGNTYDAIIMDPPSYGRGPKGEIWKIEDMIHPLIKLCTKILSKDALFFLVNSYTTGLAPAVLTYMIATELKPWNGHVESQEIGLPVTRSGLVLPCGASGRWESLYFLTLYRRWENMNQNIKKKFAEYYLYFMMYSIIGWIYEVFLEVVVYRWGFSNRGVLFGPYCIIYGVGALILIFSLGGLQKKRLYLGKVLVTPVLVFIGIVVITTVVELIASYIMEFTQGGWQWDYTRFAFNFEGRIALNPSIRFGIGGMVFLYLLQPLFKKLTGKMSDRTLYTVSLIFLILFIADIIYTYLF